MKQFKTISVLAFVLTTFSIAEMAAQQHWRLSLTTDYQVSLSDKTQTKYWNEALGDEYGSLRSHKKQKSSVILNSDYHFLTQKPVGFFIGTGVGYRKYGAVEKIYASYYNTHIFPLRNIIVPWRIGIDIRPNDKFTINVSATYEHMFPIAAGNRSGIIYSSQEPRNDEYNILGEISDTVSSIRYGSQNQGGIGGSLDVGFDIEIYKNYHLFIGTGVGGVINHYRTGYTIRRFSSTGEPDADSTDFPYNSGSNLYDFISLKTGITKTF